MSPLAQLLADCESAGIRLLLKDRDELTIDGPSKAITPELIQRLKAQKQQLLRILHAPEKAVLSERACQPDDWPETIDVREVAPCPKCGTLELWETMAGNWRCLRCDPPTRWRKFAAKHRIR